MHFIKYNPGFERLYATQMWESETETALTKTESLDALFQNAIINGYISAELLQEQLFPSTQAKVFISHSSADAAVALMLKAKLQEGGISAFVDSEVWENVYEILERYQFPEGVTRIPAEEGNAKSKHLYLMLAGALGKTIFNSDWFVYVVPSSEELDNPEQLNSRSPWLAYELRIAEMIYKMGLAWEKCSALRTESVADMPLQYDVTAPFIERMVMNADKVVGVIKNNAR